MKDSVQAVNTANFFGTDRLWRIFANHKSTDKAVLLVAERPIRTADDNRESDR